MEWRIYAAALSAACLFSLPASAQDWPACGTVDTWPGDAWPQATPADGWDTDALEAARRVFEASDADSVMIVHRGHPVAAWGDVDEPLTIQSMRKPVLGAVLGRLIADGHLDIDATLEELGIDDSDPPLTEAERQATVRDLLQARSGILHDANYEVGGWRRIREQLRDGQAGSRRGLWFYNNWDFNALGTIAEEAGHAPVGQLLDRHIARPIAMQDFDPDRDAGYSGRDSLAQQHFGYGSDHPAYMFEMSTRDLARFGLLYLGCGNWDGEQVLPRDWILQSWTGRDTYEGLPEGVVTGFDRYGFLWWIENGGDAPRFGPLEFAQPFAGASGNRGHYMLVMPRYDLVIVHQPRTIGGIGDAVQRERAMNGSPEVSEREFADLVLAVLAAHPDA